MALSAKDWATECARQELKIISQHERIRELEAEVRALRSAGYSCPTCDSDAVDSVADREAK